MTDEELVAKALSDPKAEEELIERYKDAVRAKAHLYFLLGGDESDLVQEGTIGLFGAIRSYSADKGTSFRTYADICINSRILNAVKAAAREKHKPLNTSLSLDAPLAAAGEGEDAISLGESIPGSASAEPEAAALRSELFEFISNPNPALFSELESSVLKRMLSGESYSSAAEALGITKKAYDNAVQRIRRKIREQLRD